MEAAIVILFNKSRLGRVSDPKYMRQVKDWNTQDFVTIFTCTSRINSRDGFAISHSNIFFLITSIYLANGTCILVNRIY